MEIVAAASFITAFLAGFAALLAPCCIGVLLPSYLASVFKTKTKLFLMTFVYFLGLLTIFLPLGLGMAGLGAYLSRNHEIFFTLGGVFMVLLGLSLVVGRSFMLPVKVKPHLEKYDLGSIYILGVFSGVATSCCAPVLAGVLALSALPGSWLLGGIYALTFVTGMAVPLFAAAVLADRTNVMNRLKSLRRKVSYSLFGKSISVSLSHLISGSLFLVFGLFILIFQRVNPDAFGSGYQLQINLLTAQLTRTISRVTSLVPEVMWAAFFILVFALISWIAYKQAQNLTKDKDKGPRA